MCVGLLLCLRVHLGTPPPLPPQSSPQNAPSPSASLWGWQGLQRRDKCDSLGPPTPRLPDPPLTRP